MTRDTTPMRWRHFVVRGVLAGLRSTLTVSPWPMVWVTRRQFADTGKQLAATLSAQAPADVSAVIDERYDDSRDALLDVYTPGADVRPGPLPTVVWIHGGGFVGGTKDEIGGYLRMIAAAGFCAVGVDYALAPEARYPTPLRQVMAALRHLQDGAERLHVDPGQFVLAGDSAGAHIAAQIAAIATNPGYGAQIGVNPTITADQLRGIALCCGVYDLSLFDSRSPMKDFMHMVTWAYSGSRNYRNNAHFTSTMAVTDHVTEAFPPVFITVGNADLLVDHSHALAAVLESKGVDVETLFYPADHQPPLPHEYQFDVNLDEGRVALRRLIDFFQRRTRRDDDR